MKIRIEDRMNGHVNKTTMTDRVRRIQNSRTMIKKREELTIGRGNHWTTIAIEDTDQKIRKRAIDHAWMMSQKR